MAQRLKVDLSEHVVPLSSLFSFQGDCHHLVPHSPIPLQRRPRWLMLCMTAALFFYQTFDAMDGKQVPSPVKKCPKLDVGNAAFGFGLQSDFG